MLYWLVHITAGILSRCLFSVEIRGGENIPEKGAFILASNHRSNIDPVLLATSVNRKLFFLAKAELFENHVISFILKKLNCIELRRSGEDKAALKKGLKVLRSGRGLLLFPEGKRSKDNFLGRGKPGLSLFAFATGVTVVPVFITGTEKVLPIGSRMISLSKIIVVFGEPLYAKKNIDHNARKSEYQHFVDKIMEAIAILERNKAQDYKGA
jgi:1-acyl-sn-glycerol-3-phosphate acyltransferase